MTKRLFRFFFHSFFYVLPSFLYSQYQERKQRKEVITTPIKCATAPYELVWQDEFNGMGLDTTYWQTAYGNPKPWDCTLPRATCGTELQVYRPENVVVSDGTLKLIAQKEKYLYKGVYEQDHPCATKHKGEQFALEFDYTSGLVETKAEAIAFKYGRFEIKCKLPIGTSLWPAFWLWGGGGATGRAGEIDILELFNTAKPIFTTSVHNGRQKARVDVAIDWDITKWHTYAVEWEPTVIKYYIDDRLVRVYERFKRTDCNKQNGVFQPGRYRRNRAFPREQWMVLRINLAMNPAIDQTKLRQAVFPAIMEVDYVRVYKRPSF